MNRLFTAVVIVLVTVATASAAIQVGDRLTYVGQTPGKSYGSGGEFTWTLTKNANYPEQPGSPNGFQPGATSTVYSFCAEKGQSVKPVTYVTNFALTDSDASHSIKDFGQWLFFRYANGGNTSVPTHAQLTNNLAGAMQWSLWNDMGYTGLSASPLPAQDAAWHTAYLNDTAWLNRDKTKIYVQIAWLSVHYSDVPNSNNNYTIGQGHAQDQLVFVSAGGLGDVPEPATIIIWSLLSAGTFLGLNVTRRRNHFAKRQPWSPQNRQAILSMIEVKHQEPIIASHD